MALVLHQFYSKSLPTRTSFFSTTSPCLGRPISLATLNVANSYRPVLQCIDRDIITPKISNGKTVTRRSANYQPPIWHFDYVQSLTSVFTGEKYAGKIEELKQEVRVMLKKMEDDPLALLEHIDALQRLGISYHFENEIKRALKGIYESTNKLCDDEWKRDNLYATALEFRLLRQHGFWLPQDVFDAFKDRETGKFKACGEEALEMLNLYEASFHLIKGEHILEEARDFSTRYLEMYLEKNKNHRNNNDCLSLLVSHALEIPLHWRMIRLEARWFIDLYEKREDKNPLLLQLAKLDFNIVQSTHQEDLKYASRWWRNTSLGQKLEFARDRLMENFLWTVGVVFEPQFGYCRRMSTKVNALITVIDDIYDVYGTLDELELFTDAVERWNVNAMDGLPEYMKICFFALHNSVNDMAFDVLKEQQLYIIKYLKKAWTDICKSYLQEAKWYYSGYMPTLEEYIENAWVSISAPLILVHAYFFIANPISDEALGLLDEYSTIIRQSSMILRLADDLGTSSEEIKRGDVPKSIQCYMNEAGVGEEEARRHIKFLISETWKQLNEDRFASSAFPKPFVEIAINLGRMAQCMYEHGDGHGIQDGETKHRVLSLLVDPIS